MKHSSDTVWKRRRFELDVPSRQRPTVGTHLSQPIGVKLHYSNYFVITLNALRLRFTKLDSGMIARNSTIASNRGFNCARRRVVCLPLVPHFTSKEHLHGVTGLIRRLIVVMKIATSFIDVLHLHNGTESSPRNAMTSRASSAEASDFVIKYYLHGVWRRDHLLTSGGHESSKLIKLARLTNVPEASFEIR